MPEDKDGLTAGERSCIKGLSFIASSSGDANTSIVDVKNGRIVRIRPLHFDWKYSRESFNPWKMEARGKTFEPLMKSLVAPYSLAYKKRVYSTNRILYPMKRVDWDPQGERNVQNRGVSKYVRISWDEALDIIVSEIKRIKSQYGTSAILSQQDGHGETKMIHGTHGCQYKLLNLLGGPTIQVRNADSWEGWYWGGRMPGVWASGADGTGDVMRILLKTLIVSVQGCDRRLLLGFRGQMASRLCYWWTDLGIKSIYISPDLNYGAAVHADKWIPVLPNTDAALQLAIAYTWISEGTYDKEYVKTHTFGFEKFEEYVMGKEDDIPKTPAWAAPRCGVPEWTIKALARDWASRRVTIAHGNGGPGIRGPYSSETGRLEVCLLAMQGLGKPGAYQVKMLEWGRRSLNKSNPMPVGVHIPKVISVYTGAMQFTAVDKQTIGVGDKDVSKGIKVTRRFLPKNLIHDAILNPPLAGGVRPPHLPFWKTSSFGIRIQSKDVRKFI